MEQMPTPTKLFPYPSSWYVIENSDNLKPLQLINKKIAGKEFVLFRTEKGEAARIKSKVTRRYSNLPRSLYPSNMTRTPDHTGFCYFPRGLKSQTFLAHSNFAFLSGSANRIGNSPPTAEFLKSASCISRISNLVEQTQ